MIDIIKVLPQAVLGAVLLLLALGIMYVSLAVVYISLTP